MGLQRRTPAKRSRDGVPAERESEGSSAEDEPGIAGGEGAAEQDGLHDGDVAPGDRLGRGDSVPSVQQVAQQLGLAQLTPLERQVVALKAKHPGYCLVFEVGYRYTFFGEDAALAAQLLDIWAYRKHHLTVASVPTHRLDVHLARLLQAGLRVGVVDQAETAARKKAGVGGAARSGTFERKVSGLYTRGSYVPASDEHSLNASNQIVLLLEAKAKAGKEAGNAHLSLLALDTYSNTLLYDAFDDGPLRSELHARLCALGPAEVLVPNAPSQADVLAPIAPSHEPSHEQPAAQLGARPDAQAGDGAIGRIGLSRESALALLSYAQPPPPAASSEAGGVRQGSRADVLCGGAARLELLPQHAYDLGAALQLLANEGAEGEEGTRAAANATALPVGVGLALGALAYHLSSLVGRGRTACLLRLALAPAHTAGGGEGGGEGGGGRCVSWSDARTCTLGSQLLRDLDVFDLPPTGAGGGGGGSVGGPAASGQAGSLSLYSHLNRTHTQPGARLLRRWLCAPLRDGAEIEARLSAVGVLVRAQQEAGGSAGRRAGRRASASGSARAAAASSSPFARAAAGAAAAEASFALPLPPAVELSSLTASLGTAPCRDIERALTRLATGRCGSAELWRLLCTLDALLATLTAGVALPAEEPDELPDDSASGRRLLAALLGQSEAADAGGAGAGGAGAGVGAGGAHGASEEAHGSGAPRSDAELLGCVRAWLGALRQEGMLSGDLTAAFRLDSPQAAHLAEYAPLLKAQQQIEAVERKLETEALPAARAALRRPTLCYKKVHLEEYLLEVPAAAARAVPADFERVCATKAAVRFRSPAVSRLWAELQLQRETFALAAQQAFAALCHRVTACTAPIRALVQRMATLDVLQAFAHCASEHSYCQPRVLRAHAPGQPEPPPRLWLLGARHPTAELHPTAGGGSYVPNDVRLRAHRPSQRESARGASGEGQARAGGGSGCNGSGSGSGVGPGTGGGGGDYEGEQSAEQAQLGEDDAGGAQCALLFGPNSGGKSLYARMALSLALMAQIGCWLPAASAELTPFDGFYSRIGSHDRILSGESTFMVELSEAAAVLASATDRSLLLFDELGRGTSTHDGTAIAYATLEHLLTRVRGLTLFISHYPMLAQLERAHAHELSCYHMAYIAHGADEDAAPTLASAGSGAAEGQRAGRQITFLFKITKGKLESSFGVNVARMAKLPEEVLREAARRSEALERLVTQRRLLSAIQRAVAEPAGENQQANLRALQVEASEALARRAA